jgi:hypothetical protein
MGVLFCAVTHEIGSEEARRIKDLPLEGGKKEVDSK